VNRMASPRRIVATIAAELAVYPPIAIAAAISVVTHTVVIFGVGFTLPDPKMLKNWQPPLEVVLVNSRTRTAPKKADALAQANLEGGGNVADNRQAKSPLPVNEIDQPETAARKVEMLEEQAQQLVAQVKSRETMPVEPPKDTAPSEEEAQTENLAERSLEMAKLQAQISRTWDAYQRRPKRMFIGARTREYGFARYVEDWRVKVERVGNLNYPEAARRDRLYGSLILTVSINADGTVDSIDIDRSSGHKVLDAAAVKIVGMAAPYAPFTAEMRKKVDILSITRTWTFTRSDQLVSGN
jgi:periplasmic protein TonB